MTAPPLPFCMRSVTAPIHDVFTDHGTIRPDGRVLYDR